MEEQADFGIPDDYRDAEDYWDTIRSIKEAYASILRGEQGRCPRETSAEIRRELGLRSEFCALA